MYNYTLHKHYVRVHTTDPTATHSKGALLFVYFFTHIDCMNVCFIIDADAATPELTVVNNTLVLLLPQGTQASVAYYTDASGSSTTEPVALATVNDVSRVFGRGDVANPCGHCRFANHVSVERQSGLATIECN